MRVGSFLAVGSAALVSALVVPAPAEAGRNGHPEAYEVKHLQVLSGPTPFADGCPGSQFDAGRIPGYEMEPMIAVNPRNSRNIVATWQQDVGGFQAARSDLIASSHDAGKSWTLSTIPGLSLCTGGTADAASDPWLSVGPDGTAYFIGSAAHFEDTGGVPAIVASHSKDGGLNWSRPVTLAVADARNDKPAITADPVVSGRAYATWGNWDHFLNFPFANFTYASRTDDGGATWSAAAVVDSPPPNALEIPSVTVVPRHGALLNVFARVSIFPDFTATQDFLAARSRDCGRTWLPSTTIAQIPLAAISDPETGEGLPQPGFHSAAVGDGTVYVAWEHNRSATSGGIDVARSSDGGRTWTVAPLPGMSAYAFEPSIAVDARGTVGVIWYDLRNDVSGDASLTADVWFSHSSDDGASWKQIHVAGPTDLRTAPLVAHNRVGEYQGLAARGDLGFVAIFTLAAPQASDGLTDIFFARIDARNDDDHTDVDEDHVDED